MEAQHLESMSVLNKCCALTLKTVNEEGLDWESEVIWLEGYITFCNINPFFKIERDFQIIVTMLSSVPCEHDV